MSKMNIILKDNTEQRFRKTVADVKGYKKGNLSEALEEAIDLWIRTKTTNKQSKI
jgi:hypothetical protein